MVKIIRQGRALNVLLRLLLSQDARRLIRVQRRQTVLEPRLESSDEDAMSDEAIMRWAMERNALGNTGTTLYEQQLQRGVLLRTWG